MGSMNIYNGTNKASITYSGTSDVSVDATNLSGLTGNVQTQLGTKANTADLKEIGVGQTWQNVTASRALGVTYTNTTGKPIMVAIGAVSSTNGYVEFVVGGFVSRFGGTVAAPVSNYASFVVPNGNTYSLYVSSGGFLASWLELR